MASIKRSDETYLADARAAAMVDVPKTGHVMIILLCITVALAIGWAYYAVLDEQTNAEGRVIPTSQNQMIQSLEGGILDKIYVKEGEIVNQGQPLVEIDNTIFLSELREAQSKKNSLLAKVARLRAEANNNAQVKFNQEIMQKQELIQRELSLLNSRKLKFEAELKEKVEKMNGLDKEYKITKPLVEKGLMSSLDLLRIERQLAEASAQVEQHEQSFREKVFRELSDAKNDFNALEEKMVALKDKVKRTTILSPARAQVKQLKINTVGGVISPGMEIMELVPLDEQLLIQAKVRPSDVGFLHPSQKVLVKVTAYDYSIHGGIEGTLKSISADTIKDDNGESFYHVTVVTDQNYLDSKTGQRLSIIPGMTVTAHILTGKKTVLEYIMKPIRKGLSTALTER